MSLPLLGAGSSAPGGDGGNLLWQPGTDAMLWQPIGTDTLLWG